MKEIKCELKIESMTDKRNSEGLKIGVIGCGSISRRHMAASTRLEDVEITAASSRASTSLDEVSEDYGISNLFTDWRELVQCDAVDAVLICLPDGLHEEVTVEAARYGKHVLVEKPMSRTLPECESMVAAAAEAAVVLMVAQSTRQVDSHRHARRLIQDGSIGTVISAVRRRHGNVIETVRDKAWYTDPQMSRDLLLFGLGSHEYDTMLWLLESEAEEVVAKGRKDRAIWPGWISIESTMKLRNGITCTVSMSAKSDEAHGDTKIEGSQGSMTITQNRLSIDGRDMELPWDGVTTFAAQLGEFAECVGTGREPGPSGRNVQATMAVLEGLHESLQYGRHVELAELGVTWNG